MQAIPCCDKAYGKAKQRAGVYLSVCKGDIANDLLVTFNVDEDTFMYDAFREKSIFLKCTIYLFIHG